MPRCPRRAAAHVKQDGRTASGQRYRCHGCRRTFTEWTGTPFAGYRWERDIIALAVHWVLPLAAAENSAALDGHKPSPILAGVIAAARTRPPLAPARSRR